MTVSLALLGCGAITRAHARTLGRFGSRVRLAFASRDPARAEAFRRAAGGFAAFGEYAAALGDPRIDAVLVATPPVLHLPLTLDALRAGKHVIVEKPAFLRAGDFAQVEAAAASAGRRVLVAENYAYKPVTLLLGRLLAAGEIGALRMVRLSALKSQATPDWRGSLELAGGGALFEGGVHWINLLGWLGLGGGTEISGARGFRPGDGTGLERSMVVVVRYANGAVGTLHHSWEAPARLKGLSLSQVIGERGTLLFESNGLFVALNGKRKRLFFPWRDLKGFRAMFSDFLRVLESDGSATPRLTLRMARRDLELIEDAYRTAAQG